MGKNNNHNIKALQTALLETLPSTRVREEEYLRHHTTFKIGGPADLFVEPTTMAELSFALRTIHEFDVPVTIIGCGSNILVKDGGIRGAVVSVRHMTQIMDCNDNVLCIGSGYMLKDASEFAWENGLTGLEFAIGIPGTLGGAVFMNAGAYDGEMSHVVTAVRAVDFQGNIKEYDASHLDFAYRHSIFHDNHEVIGEVIMTLKPGDKAAIKARMDELTEKRESKQPLEFASAGSTFKRPPGYFAGTLIEQTGLKGLSVGDAQVSHKHAGFVINTGSASAKDVLDLIAEVQRRVYDQHGVHLEPEVRMIGED
ncbi:MULTISPECIES: UDP-N-acetylmuramate dehydrogenase [Veillonella]|uniref:UDP-N-acetylenolpyruvoylglucosamine reductase n=1 Tax=Veillonella atypica KON TaxID=1128111 RepID=A0ABN0II63_9FIRM|nr:MULTISPECIES: UDP-N-acetylmuramate dehydrogenase [Veillonella]EKY17326.1 UDP-N-acetylmuramate dehydrogenase [Veillonella atypica KON]MBS5711717.1 UDP-N-acetylmuramate dehydrogenase [Veillonella sp.]PQL16829.1 UDP-N-acetylmuramate dehydrogenase [Veillonella atypica KON]SUP07075.1 UDP-N-acetylenolpyruvoylglucosamine reductase [Veillonella atypica]